MTEENTNQQAPRQSFSQTLKAARNHGEGPNNPVEEPAPVVTPESTPEVPTQEPAPVVEQNAQPESFTGNETAEQLNEVSKNPSTHNRIQKLAQERNAATQAQLQAEQQVGQLRQQAEEQRQQLELAQQSRQPQVDQFAFKEQFPEEGSIEEQESFRIRKEAYERDTLPALKQQAEYFAKLTAPLQQEAAMRSIEGEWNGIADIMERNGTSRAELEPMVMQVLTSPGGAHRNVRSVAHDVMAQMGVFDRYVPEPGNTTVPGGGNAPPVVPEVQQPLHSDPKQAAIMQARQTLAQNQNPAAARQSFRDVLKSQRRPAE